MARLEDLIKDIADPRLRSQIAAEVEKLKTKKEFGLVFEQHLPEVVQLLGLPIKPGTRVVKRADKNAGFFLIKSIVNGKKVSVIPERGGGEEVLFKDELVAVKRFGEPMYPALVPVEAITRAPGKPYHTLINADNFHAPRCSCTASRVGSMQSTLTRLTTAEPEIGNITTTTWIVPTSIGTANGCR
jgi:adenine-specific DNA-methyltransferase